MYSKDTVNLVTRYISSYHIYIFYHRTKQDSTRLLLYKELNRLCRLPSDFIIVYINVQIILYCRCQMNYLHEQLLYFEVLCVLGFETWNVSDISSPPLCWLRSLSPTCLHWATTSPCYKAALDGSLLKIRNLDPTWTKWWKLLPMVQRTLSLTSIPYSYSKLIEHIETLVLL